MSSTRPITNVVAMKPRGYVDYNSQMDLKQLIVQWSIHQDGQDLYRCPNLPTELL